ncbi:hypothetical protein [Streptomyces cyaneus]|uniref:hypothetical protein n=1 Tax=Streptomyces cyaneus TaxID=1904 RepID=UPI0015E8D5FB|nr:hypothetical protein [Streptomyces cyaneus]
MPPSRIPARALPAPRTPDDADQVGADTVTDPAGPPAPPRRRRVRMLVDVVDHPDEVAYVTALFEERGWAVRLAEGDEAAPGVAHRTTLVVEVRLHGARLGALRTATRGISNGYSYVGCVATGPGRLLNLREPGVVRGIVDEATARRLLPGGAELDGWELFDAVLSRAAAATPAAPPGSPPGP